MATLVEATSNAPNAALKCATQDQIPTVWTPVLTFIEQWSPVIREVCKPIESRPYTGSPGVALMHMRDPMELAAAACSS